MQCQCDDRNIRSFFEKVYVTFFFMFVSCCLKHILTLFKWNQHNFKIFARFWSIFVEDLITISTRFWLILMKDLNEISTNFNSRSRQNFNQSWFKISSKFWSTWIQDLDEILINFDSRSQRNFDQHEFRISTRSRQTLT